MCAGAIINSRIDRVVYGASDYKGGAVESLFNVLSHPGLNHEPELASGVLGDECSQIMKDFLKSAVKHGGVPKRLKGPHSKCGRSGNRRGGSNPSSSAI